VALADAGAAPGEGPEERLARYRSMVSRGGETEETIAARLALLLDAVARARVRLGVGDPPEDALRPGEMSAEQAEQVLLGMR
jgi:ParB-like chromosome segregation protein Spo0J